MGVALAILLSFSLARAADDPRGLALLKDYVEPMLREHCYECHGHVSAQAKGGLVLDSASGWRIGGDKGPAVVAGKPDDSPLLQAILANGRRPVPAYHQISEDFAAHVREWISLGAPDFRVASPNSDLRSPSSGSAHWSFQPVKRPPVPPLRTPHSALRTEVDAFVAAKLAGKSASIQSTADRHTLIRRAYFDLIGLPPAPEEVESFIADPDPRAYERLVNRLLESPHYGERWGRHWLDVAGFAESSMFIGDIPRQGFWRYRDYVIRAFNEDKPYDQFVIEQLAGDELFNWRDADTFTDEQVDRLAATGFLRCTPDATDNQAITQMDKRFIAQQSAVEVSMKALLGLTVNCVRCHDHKFDPIKQEEYYRLIAVFQPAYDPAHWLPGIWSEQNAGPLRVIPLLPADERRQVMTDSPGWYDKRLALGEQVKSGLDRPRRDQWLREHLGKITDEATRRRVATVLDTPVGQRAEGDEEFCTAEAHRLGLTEEKVKELFPEIEQQRAAAKARLKELNERHKEVFKDVIWATFDTTTTPSPSRFLKRGNYETPGHEVQPGVIAVLDRPDRTALFDERPGDWTTGRRLALARWLTHPEHPLVARVMVNRIWQYHFGTGIVSTPDDFGARGSRPASQELLDWLAMEFVEHDWSVKHIHRLIMNSATYRQATVAETRNRARPSSSSSKRIDYKDENDDGNDPLHLFAAFTPGPRRLEAGALRDAMIEVSGRLDKRLFGLSVPTERRGDGSFDIKQGHADRLRRTVYIHTRRTYVPTFLTLFDEPQMDTNWSKRSTSAIAQQALALMNEPFVAECASVFATRVLSEGGNSFESRLRRAFELVYQRAPSAEEATTFQQATTGAKNPWPTICQALFSSSEFLYAD